MENEKVMDKQGMTNEREMEILERVAERVGALCCATRLRKQLDRTYGAARQYQIAVRTGEEQEEAAAELRKQMAALGVWLNVIGLIVGEPVEEEIAYLEELAEVVGADGE